MLLLVDDHPLTRFRVKMEMFVGHVEFDPAEAVVLGRYCGVIEIVIGIKNQVNRIAVFEEMGGILRAANHLVVCDTGDQACDTAGRVIEQEIVEFADKGQVDHRRYRLWYA